MIENISFLKSITNKKIISNNQNEKISFKEYFNSLDDDTGINIKDLLLNFLSKFINSGDIQTKYKSEINSVYEISKEEKLTMDSFQNRVSLEIFPLDGYIEITAIMPAQLLQN